MARLPRWILLFLAAPTVAMVVLAARGIRPPSSAPRAAPPLALTADSAAGVVRQASAAVVQVSAWRRTRLWPAWRRLAGSGFLADHDGLVVTSAELVAGASRVEVRCPGDLRSLAARVALLDTGRGVALLRLRRPPGRLPALPLGPDAGPAAGGFVLSLGADGTTLGVVSAPPRLVGLRGAPVRRLLQTDAPIPRGNLGGPLLDLGGRVVGMAALPLGTRGIGFAVSARELRWLLHRQGGLALRGQGMATGTHAAGQTARNGPFGPEPREDAKRYTGRVRRNTGG